MPSLSIKPCTGSLQLGGNMAGSCVQVHIVRLPDGGETVFGHREGRRFPHAMAIRDLSDGVLYLSSL